MAAAHALNRLILTFYRDGREVALGSFHEWALEQIKGLIPFDSAWWGNAAANPPELHDMNLHNCDQSILEAYPPYLEQDFFRAALIASPGVSINMSDLITRERFVRTPITQRSSLESVTGPSGASSTQGPERSADAPTLLQRVWFTKDKIVLHAVRTRKASA